MAWYDWGLILGGSFAVILGIIGGIDWYRENKSQ
jgi:hypothetical protein